MHLAAYSLSKKVAFFNRTFTFLHPIHHPSPRHFENFMRDLNKKCRLFRYLQQTSITKGCFLSLYRYLLNIKLGKAINAHKFQELLNTNGHQISHFGELVHLKGDSYKVRVLNPDVLETLIRSNEPAQSRIDAGIRLNDSHKHGTDSAYFVYKTLKNPVYHGAFFCQSATLIEQLWPLAPKTNVVLIENSECFTFSDEFLKTMNLNHLENTTIIVWSSGKAITHKQAIRLLSSFKKIYYCPDYDLAGLEMFETLARNLGEKIQFCMPDNLPIYAPYCKKHEKTQFSQALEKARHLGFTGMVELLESGLGVLEQEILIGNKNPTLRRQRSQVRT